MMTDPSRNPDETIGDPSLVGRPILITGGSRGIGREVALALLEAGARVAIVGMSASAPMDETIRKAQALGASQRFLPLIADLRQPQECERIVQKTLDAFGSLDVLMNNAGIPLIDSGAPFWEVGSLDWMRMVDTNINGVYLVTRCLVPHMIARGRGKIINISSGEAMMVRKNASPYGPSKAFLDAASRIWAQDLAATGVTVNVLHPGGGVETEASLALSAAGGKKLPASVMRAPMLWLCSELSDGHTGERFNAKLWDENLPLDQRVAAARESEGLTPRIL
ncbi:MAG TPA: SDR family oxidoreductase [Beijerinckiaceae bacterium]|jgi:3-oxoacyl-[acyl-carrier protein] reductase|nr:SDR family oxidoreductase [Beijerinckiaceae bacterium]